MGTKEESILTTVDFANQYIEGEIQKPEVVFHYSSLPHRVGDRKSIEKEISKLMKETKLRSIEKLEISRLTKIRLYIALHELTLAMTLPEQDFKKANKVILKSRKNTIESLNKTLGYPYLSYDIRKKIEEEIQRLTVLDKRKKEYHPMHGLDYLATRELRKVYDSESTAMMKRSKLSKSDVLELKSHLKLYHECSKKLEAMHTIPVRIREGRKAKYFPKVLQVVIYKLLSETPRPKGRGILAQP